MLQQTYMYVTDGPPGEQSVQLGPAPQQIPHLKISRMCESTATLTYIGTDPEQKSAQTELCSVSFSASRHNASTPWEKTQVHRMARKKARESPKAPEEQGSSDEAAASEA